MFVKIKNDNVFDDGAILVIIIEGDEQIVEMLPSDCAPIYLDSYVILKAAHNMEQKCVLYLENGSFYIEK